MGILEFLIISPVMMCGASSIAACYVAVFIGEVLIFFLFFTPFFLLSSLVSKVIDKGTGLLLGVASAIFIIVYQINILFFNNGY